MTQHTLIIDYMREHGSITTYDAFMELGITKLTTRISELRRAGFKIRGVAYSGLNRFGKPVTYNRYTLIDDDAKANKAGSVIV